MGEGGRGVPHLDQGEPVRAGLELPLQWRARQLDELQGWFEVGGVQGWWEVGGLRGVGGGAGVVRGVECRVWKCRVGGWCSGAPAHLVGQDEYEEVGIGGGGGDVRHRHHVGRQGAARQVLGEGELESRRFMG